MTTTSAAIERGRGGYHPGSRLVGLLYDIKVEALAARQSQSRDRRDRAFIEVAQLAQAAADLVEAATRTRTLNGGTQ